MRGEGKGGRVEVQMHARIVDKGCLMDVDVKPVICAHLKGSLHSVD